MQLELAKARKLKNGTLVLSGMSKEEALSMIRHRLIELQESYEGCLFAIFEFRKYKGDMPLNFKLTEEHLEAP